MKKTYITPSLEVVRVQTQQMLAVSKLGIGDPISDASGAEAPEYDFWGE